jgi:RIO-like serine/threonine protein kinase
MPKGNGVCHGDFTPGNVIVKTDGTYYIIDWAHATQGSSAADAARTYLRFRLAKCDNWAETYLRLFCKKSDTARQYIQRWFPIVAASESVKKKPGEEEMLAKWVNVVDYE